MAFKHFQSLFICRLNHLSNRKNGFLQLNILHYHTVEESGDQEPLPSEWYEKAFRKIRKLSCSLNNVDLIDGRLVNVNDDSIIVDECVEQRMRNLKFLVRVFLGSKFASNCLPDLYFRNPSEREPMVVDSLTKVSEFLNVSAQQRKLVRHTIGPQVTQHRIWTGALEQMLKELRFELDTSPCNKGRVEMGQQIVSSCLKFLDDATYSTNAPSSSWMRPAPLQPVIDSSTSPKWEDVFEMFNDLIDTTKDEKWLLHSVTKLEVMKEGLAQIKDVLTDKSIGFKEGRHQESLVQKKLTKGLGHSSRCLFTLLLYYLFGQVRDIEIDICGGVFKAFDEEKFCLYMGRILSSDEERMVWNGVRQLDRAMGLFKFIWETAGMKGGLELQGHLWCVEAQERQINYKGNAYILHQISFNG